MTVAPPRPIRLRSTSSTCAPARAAAMAAYIPAAPEPMMSTSACMLGRAGDGAAIDPHHAIDHPLGVLQVGLREHHRHPFLLKPRNDLGQALRERRGDTFEGLVQEKQLRAAH